MKTKQLIHFIVLFFLMSFFSCQQSKEEMHMKDAATGNPGEVLVVMPDESWKGEAGDALRAVYHQDLYTVPQEEFVFDLYQIDKAEFNGLNKRNRNVIMPEIGKGAEYGQISVKSDVYSEPQTVVYIKAPDMVEFTRIVKEKEQTLIEIFKKADRDRLIPYLKKYHIEKYSNDIVEKYGVYFAVPRSYTFDEKREDFAWLSYETVHATQSFLVYRYPADSTREPSLDYLVKKRNEILKENVPGARPESYMSTETKYHYPIMSARVVNNFDCWVMEGLWKVVNDFMGGPFISFTMYDEATNEYVTIEAFVYDPRGNNRDQIRKLEASLWTMELK